MNRVFSSFFLYLFAAKVRYFTELTKHFTKNIFSNTLSTPFATHIYTHRPTRIYASAYATNRVSLLDWSREPTRLFDLLHSTIRIQHHKRKQVHSR